MPLAGLILGNEDTNLLAGALPALLAVAGQTLIEYQVRVAHKCGVRHIVVVVDHMPSALVSAFDRLRAEGIDIEIARDARDAADRIHPDEALLVMAKGSVASHDIIAAVIALGKPVMLTVADTPENERYERIDARARWTGIALLDGTLLRATAAILGDWALGPTLLRTAVQGGVNQQNLGEGALIALIDNEAAARAFSHRLALGSGSYEESGIASKLITRFAHKVIPFLLDHKVPLDLMVMLPLVMVASAILLALTGWLAAGFGVFLLASILAGVAQVIANIGARHFEVLAWFSRLKLSFSCALLLISAWMIRDEGSAWGVIIAALWASSLLLLMNRKRTEKIWYVDCESVAPLMFVATLIAQPLGGLMLIIVHALATRIDERRIL